jgi:phage-related minor tail protein
MSDELGASLGSDIGDAAIDSMTANFAERSDEVADTMEPAAKAISETFQSVGGTIADELTKAAKTGEVSFKDMAKTIGAELANLAVDQLIAGPLENAFGGEGGGGFLSGLSGLFGGGGNGSGGSGGFFSDLMGAIPFFGGGRADGGPVNPGHAFLVGEQGPELFMPGQSGRIEDFDGRSASAMPASSGAQNTARPLAITMNVSGVRDADSFRRSQAQVLAGLRKAVDRGTRGL